MVPIQIAGNKPLGILAGSREVELCVSLVIFPSSCHRVPSAARTHCLVVVELEYQSSLVLRVITWYLSSFSRFPLAEKWHSVSDVLSQGRDYFVILGLMSMQRP